MPFRFDKPIETAKIIFFELIPYFFLNLLSIGLNIERSIPLCITCIGYSERKDCFTNPSSQLEGVTIISF